jgi:hypothetical protein
MFFTGTFALWPGVSSMMPKGANHDRLSAKLQVINKRLGFLFFFKLVAYLHTHCLDDRFIMKHIKSIEISSFEQFAPHYLEHVNKALEEKV